MKTYKINGKEIQGLIEYNPNDLSVHSLTHQRDVLLKINELLEALSDKEECKHVGSFSLTDKRGIYICDGCGRKTTHEEAVEFGKEPKQSTNLKDVSCKCCKNCI